MKIKYADYQNMIYSLAHRFNKTTGIETEELISCGNLEFVRCQKTFNPMLASFSTYLTIRIKGLFLEMGTKKRKQPLFINFSSKSYSDTPIYDLETSNFEKTSIWNTIQNGPNPEEYLFFKEILQELSDDAKEVTQIVFETPLDLINMIRNQKQPRGVNKHQLQKHLRKQGWTFTRIWESFKEISLIL